MNVSVGLCLNKLKLVNDVVVHLDGTIFAFLGSKGSHKPVGRDSLRQRLRCLTCVSREAPRVLLTFSLLKFWMLDED